MEYIHDSTAYHPLLPRKMVLGGLPWVAVLICSVPDAPFAVEEADAASSNLLAMAHQPTVDLLSWTRLLLSLARNAQVAALRAKSATFAVALAIEPIAHHAAVLRVAKCDRVLAAESLPNFPRHGLCQMHPLMTYIHLCAPSCCSACY